MKTKLKAYLYISALACAFSLIALTLSSAIPFLPYISISAAIVVICTIIKPDLALAGFLFFLPFFGNKPGTRQASCLMTLGLSLQLGLSLALIIRRPKTLNFKALAPVFWYLVISALSIFPVSFAGLWDWLRSSQTGLSDFSLINWNISSLLLAREDDPVYPLLSVIWTALAFGLCYFVYYFSCTIKNSRTLFCWTLFAGFLCSLLVGLMNYYGLLSLTWLRELDPVVNPGGTQYRLQSWFGHSGWFAEYVTLLAPFSMLLLTLGLTFWKRVSLLLLILLIGEIVLILTFQRGGWLSYPVTLLAIWTSIYVLRRIEKGDRNILLAFRSSMVKILISIPITLLISFLILKTLGSQFGLDQYAGRLKDITKTSDRSEFLRAGFKLGALNPVLGQGSESFAIQYSREFKESDGAYSGQIDLPLHGTAHNLYAQTFAGKGTLGLLSLLLILFFGIQRGLSFVLKSRVQESRSEQIIALACVCSITACFIYGFVQELFYVQSLQYVVFAVLGILASLHLNKTEAFEGLYRVNARIAVMIAALFVAHLLWVSENRRPYRDSGGCYEKEAGATESWRWCGVRSSIDIPIEGIENKILTFETAPARNSQSKSQLASIEACNKTVFSKEMLPSERAQFPVKIDPVNCTLERPGFLRLYAYSARYFIPAKEDRDSKDRRVLALRWINPDT